MRLATALTVASVALAADQWQNLYTLNESCKSEKCAPYIGTGAKLGWSELFACLESAQDCPFKADFLPENPAPETTFERCALQPQLYGANLLELTQYLGKETLGTLTPVPARLLLTFDQAMTSTVTVEVRHSEWSTACSPERYGEPRPDLLIAASLTVGSKTAYIDCPAYSWERGVWVTVKSADNDIQPVKISLDSNLLWTIGGLHISGTPATFASAALLAFLAATVALF